ncbi:MAG: hypothetical protein QM489_00385 [Candidatus Izemoplasma sp.]
MKPSMTGVTIDVVSSEEWAKLNAPFRRLLAKYNILAREMQLKETEFTELMDELNELRKENHNLNAELTSWNQASSLKFTTNMIFRLYDPKLAKLVTKNGQKLLKQIEKQICKQICKQ